MLNVRTRRDRERFWLQQDHTSWVAGWNADRFSILSSYVPADRRLDVCVTGSQNTFNLSSTLTQRFCDHDMRLFSCYGVNQGAVQTWCYHLSANNSDRVVGLLESFGNLNLEDSAVPPSIPERLQHLQAFVATESVMALFDLTDELMHLGASFSFFRAGLDASLGFCERLPERIRRHDSADDYRMIVTADLGLPSMGRKQFLNRLLGCLSCKALLTLKTASKDEDVRGLLEEESGFLLLEK